MSSRKARLGAMAAAAVFVMVGATTAFAQDTTATPTGQPPVGTPVPTDGPVPPATELTTPPADPAAPMTAPPETAPPVTTPAQPTTPAVIMQPPISPSQVVVPPQENGPMTVGNFSAAVNNQAQHLRRLNQLGTVPGERITIINVANLSPSPVTAGIENAVSRAETRSAASARAAASNNASISAALSAAGISADNVVAIAVRGHNLNDVTVYHR
jgi:hypothetical protein